MSITDADAHSNLASLLLQAESQSITSSSASTFDNLTCLWAHCGERAASPEHLYEHVCDRHVGRKSTNNLNLQCQWGSCRTTTVKRDHITSHIRVHVPLKPHRCDFCGKSFKRPQDLKKHVKTHAEGTVLIRSPEPTISNEPSSNNRYQGPPTHYADQSMHSNGNYHNHSVAPSNNAFHSTADNVPNFGPVYYSAPQPGYADAGTTESRKRSYSVLNDFFGDAKRRHIDPHQYQDLSVRFGGMPNLPLPAHGSFINDFNSTSGTGTDSVQQDTTTTAMAVSHIPVPAIHLVNPFTELKTKHDLRSLDTFLETLQNTVYEHTENLSNAGVLPVSQIHHIGLNGQTNHLPSDHQSSTRPRGVDSIGSHPPSSSGSLAPPTLDDTPALTPDSHNGYSPASACSHSASPYSPGARHIGNPYPTLPSFSAMTGSQPGYVYTNGIPASYLGNSYDDLDGRRCYAGGILQRAAPASPPRINRDKRSTPTSTSRRSSAEREALLKGVQNVELASPTRAEAESPASRERHDTAETSGTNGSSSADDRQKGWIQNIRVIEALRSFVKERLQRGEYEASEVDSDVEGWQQSSSSRSPRKDERRQKIARQGSWNGDRVRDIEMLDSDRERERQRQTGSLYPILRAVEAVS